MTLRRKLIWTENPFNYLPNQHKDGGWSRLVYRHLCMGHQLERDSGVRGQVCVCGGRGALASRWSVQMKLFVG